MQPTSCLRLLSRSWSSAVLSLVLLLGACATDPHWVADRQEELRQAIVEGRLDEAEALAGRHSRALGPALALDLSVRHGQLDAARRFLAEHEINAPIDARGTTALMRAAAETPVDGGPEMIALLLDEGADPEQVDLAGRSAIDYVRDRREPAMIEAMRAGSAVAEVELDEPVTPVRWLPAIDASVPDAPAGRGQKAADKAEQARRQAWQGRVRASARMGVPYWLFGGTWLPRDDAMLVPDDIERVDGSHDPWVWAALRFHADHTGELLRYDTSDGSLSPVADAYIAWDAYRGTISFFVMTPRFASHCRSVGQTMQRMRIGCDEAAVRGPIGRAPPVGLLSQEGAARLLANAGERHRLPATGNTTSELILDDAADSCAAPRSAPKAPRRNLRVARGEGSWSVFNPQARIVFAPGLPATCSQSRARATARNDCARGGGRCVELGGCGPDQAMAVAGRNDTAQAWLACGDTDAEARRLALEACRESAGCDCQLLAAQPRVDLQACSPQR